MMVNDADYAVLDTAWYVAFDALRAAGLEADDADPIAARYRAASDAVNHANRSRDFAIFTQHQEDERRGITFTRGQVEAWVGHALTDEQVADIEEVAPNSSIPNAIETIAHDALEIEYIETCAKCGRVIAEADYGVWYHADSGPPPCDPSQVDPDAYLDIEGNKYDIATPEGV